MKKIIGIFICIFLTTTCIPVSGNIGLIKNSIFDNESVSYDPLDGGWVEEIDGVTILHLSGTNYEMGYQYGHYLKDEIVENIRCANDFLDNHGWPLEKRIDIWNIQEKYLPQVYIDEMIGMADGSGISFDSIAIYNGWLSVFNVMKCWGAALWNTATKDGELLHMRSADGTFGAKDPVTGKFIHENTVLIVRNPDNAHASIYPDFCGNVVSIGGMNEKGVCVSELTIISSDTNFQGINGGFRMRMVLDYADDIYEANDIMNSNRTCGWNFVISDGNFPVGLAIEQSANFEYTGMWCDPVESTEPFWEIRDVVRRNNCYINQLLAKTERDRYKPNGVIGLVRLILGKDGTFGAKDPITGKFIHENTVLMVRNPDNAHASIYPDFSGNVVSIGGMNEKGVCVSELTIISSDTNFQGINGGFRMRMVLDYADDIYEAKEIMNSNRTCGWNFVISDGNFPVGLAIEQSANFEYTGMWCDPVESTEPFWEIRDVVRRNNCYINPLLAKTERDRYKPNGFIGFVRWILRKDRTFIPWTQYKALSNEIEKQHGTLDLNSTMDLLRDVYNGETSLMFRYMQNRNFYSCGHQWVGCPKTGELVISFGDHENNAFVNPVHYFNFYELLNSEPP